MNRRQSQRLRRLSEWLHERDRKLLFELLVPAERAQLDAVNGDTDRYDAELRPELMLRSIAELQDARVEPDIWKIEGVDERADCERLAAECRAGGRDGVVCGRPRARCRHRQGRLPPLHRGLHRRGRGGLTAGPVCTKRLRQLLAGADIKTSVQGVVAAGDVRSGSTARCAHRLGEGARAVQLVRAHAQRRTRSELLLPSQ